MESAIKKLTVFVLLFCGHLLGQNLQRGNSSPHSYFQPMAGAPRSTAAENGVSVEPGLYTIFSNLGQKPNCYDPTNGWQVAGKQSSLQESQSIGMSFVPLADATVTEIKLPLVYLRGERGGVVSLNEDSQGLPGAPIHTWIVSKFATPPCSYLVVKSRTGLPVKKGTQYWIVASAKRTELDGWAFTYTDAKGNLAYNLGNEGWENDYGFLSAFAVLGLL